MKTNIKEISYTNNNEGDIILANGKIIHLDKGVETYCNSEDEDFSRWMRSAHDDDENTYEVVWCFETEKVRANAEDLSNLDWDDSIVAIYDEYHNNIID